MKQAKLIRAARRGREAVMDPRLHWTPEFIDAHLAGRIAAPSVHIVDLGTRHKAEPYDVAELFTREELFRLAYVPFVIGELVWDYADTVTIIAAQERIEATKPLSRFIKEQRVEYDRIRFKFIDRHNRDGEINNGYQFEDDVADITNQCLTNLRLDLRSAYPDLPEKHIMFLLAVYQCKILGEALRVYLAKQTAMVEARIRRPVTRIFPEQFFKLLQLISLYAGDKRATRRFEPLYKQYIKTFANQIALIELNEKADVEVRK